MKYILGGGIAGLITKFYNPDYTIITKSFGGTYAHYFPLGPRIMKVTPETTQLLVDLDSRGFPASKIVEIRPHRIGYMVDGEIQSVCPEGYREMYVTKTRMMRKPLSSAMSDGSNIIMGYEIDLLKAGLLGNTIDTIIGEVTEIDTEGEKIFLKDGRCLKYSKLISTVPLPLLGKICKKPGTEYLAYSSITFALCKNPSLDLKNFSYVYYPEYKYPYYRISRADKYYVVEFDNMPAEEIYLLPDFGEGRDYPFQIIDTHVEPMARILNDSDNPFIEFHGIKLVGRYAQWAHKIRISEVIKRAKEVSNVSQHSRMGVRRKRKSLRD